MDTIHEALGVDKQTVWDLLVRYSSVVSNEALPKRWPALCKRHSPVDYIEPEPEPEPEPAPTPTPAPTPAPKPAPCRPLRYKYLFYPRVY